MGAGDQGPVKSASMPAVVPSRAAATAAAAAGSPATNARKQPGSTAKKTPGSASKAARGAPAEPPASSSPASKPKAAGLGFSERLAQLSQPKQRPSKPSSLSPEAHAEGQKAGLASAAAAGAGAGTTAAWAMHQPHAQPKLAVGAAPAAAPKAAPSKPFAARPSSAPGKPKQPAEASASPDAPFTFAITRTAPAAQAQAAKPTSSKPLPLPLKPRSATVKGPRKAISGAARPSTASDASHSGSVSQSQGSRASRPAGTTASSRLAAAAAGPQQVTSSAGAFPMVSLGFVGHSDSKSWGSLRYAPAPSAPACHKPWIPPAAVHACVQCLRPDLYKAPAQHC